MLGQMVRTLRSTLIARKLRVPFMRAQLNTYLASMSADNPLRGVPVRIVGDAWGDPTELFSHYSAFGYWVAAKLAPHNKRHRILDIGSPKTQNAIFSASHDVTAVVLADCSDRFSAVNYVLHDISRPLPFSDKSFDCFTSTVSLQLVGLGRYGDRVDANCLPNLVSELGRVMSDGGRLFFSLTSGPNLLAFNNGWFLDLETTKRLFKGWHLAEALVDNWSSPKEKTQGDATQRFVGLNKNLAISPGDYRVVFFEFVRE
jgi:SAM-dependent methyltransferase